MVLYNLNTVDTTWELVQISGRGSRVCVTELLHWISKTAMTLILKMIKQQSQREEASV